MGDRDPGQVSTTAAARRPRRRGRRGGGRDDDVGQVERGAGGGREGRSPVRGRRGAHDGVHGGGALEGEAEHG